MYAHLLQELQNCNSLMNNHSQENVGSHKKKDASHPRTKEIPQQDGRRAKSHLESKPIPTRDTQRAQTKPCVHQDPETPPESDLLLSI